MKLVTTRAWLLVVLSALLQVAMFPTDGPVPCWRSLLGWIALTPLIVALSMKDRNGGPLSLKACVLLGYSTGTLWYFGNCFWIYQTMYLYGGLPKPVGFGILVLFSLYLGLYHALFALLFGFARPFGGKLVLLGTPFLWVAVELARARITSFPWDLLGYTQVDDLLLTRLAPIAGVMSLSFVVAAANAAFAAAFLLRGNKRIAVPASALLTVSFLHVAGQHLQARVDDGSSNPPARAVLMQENIDVGVVGRTQPFLSASTEIAEFSRLSLRPHAFASKANTSPFPAGGRTTKPDVVIWPEAPSHLQSNDPDVQTRLGELARDSAATLIVGTLGVDLSPEAQRGYFLYDSASFYDSSGSYLGRYDKIHLVPWGEYIPFKEVFRFAQKLTEGAGDMDRGRDRKILRSDGHSFGVFVCYESIFGDEVRQFARNGADVLVNISDDGWYGDTGAPWQHLNMARMRAVENDRWVLRSTNTGVTTSIDPHGRLIAQAPRHTRDAFLVPFHFRHNETFYTRYGDWFAFFCAGVTAGGIGISLRRGLRLTHSPRSMI